MGIGVFLLEASGCGLSEYEEQIDREQKRLLAIDEENELLGDPIEPPKIKDADPNAAPGTNAPLFFRPPEGIQANPGTSLKGDILYEYPRPYRNPYQQRRTSKKELPFLSVLVAVAPVPPPPGDWSPFVSQVQQAFAGSTASEDTPVTITPQGRPRLEFRTRSFTEPAADAKQSPTVYRVYFYKGAQYLVAIAYHLPQANATSADVDKCINASLQSLSVGPDAAPKAERWKRGHPPQTQKTPR
jgi:hypothetical protein